MSPGWALRFLVLLGLVLAGLRPALAFVGDQNASGQYRHWALNPTDPRVPATSVNATTKAILYRLDAAGWSAANRAAELTAIRTAFDQWQSIPGTVLKFEEGPSVSGTRDFNSFDNINTLFWTTNLFVNGGRDSLSGVLGLTVVATLVTGNVITDADTVFNGAQYAWFTDFNDPTVSAAFVEAIAVHEIGHFLGLLHSPVGGATMFSVGDLGVNAQVGLSTDEMAAARFLYGTTATAAGVGRVTGTVTLSGAPVLGAGVFAETTTGLLAAGTVTGSNGVYTLPALPPGGYAVRVVPLDPQATANFLVRGIDIGAAYKGANTDFVPSADRLVLVPAAGSVTADFAVTVGSPLRIARVLRPAADLSAPSFNNKPVSLQPAGQTVYLGALTLFPVTGREKVSVTGDGLTVAGPIQVLPRVVGSASLVAVPVTVEPWATPGLRDLRLEWNSNFTWAHGFIEVLPPFPDVNFDGLDDRFQRQYWPRFTSAEAAPGADPDGDGFTNRWEFATGTNPTNQLSAHFEIESVRVTPAGAQVRSRTAKGKKFQLYTRDDGGVGAWLAVGSPITAAGDLTEFLDPGATNRARFYQVRLQLP